MLPEAAEGEAGKQAFLGQKCHRCHSVASHEIEATVASEKMRGPDLSSVGGSHDVQWLGRYLRREVEVGGKSHRVEWKGRPKDLERVTDWLATLESEPDEP